MPSKYPVGSALAEYNPDEKVCQSAIEIVEKVFKSINLILS